MARVISAVIPTEVAGTVERHVLLSKSSTPLFTKTDKYLSKKCLPCPSANVASLNM